MVNWIQRSDAAMLAHDLRGVGLIGAVAGDEDLGPVELDGEFGQAESAGEIDLRELRIASSISVRRACGS